MPRPHSLTINLKNYELLYDIYRHPDFGMGDEPIIYLLTIKQNNYEYKSNKTNQQNKIN